MASNTNYDGGIDIEEHDVMEHPAFKSAFPDLSIVKTEIYDEEYDDCGAPFQDSSQFQAEEYPPMEEVAADSTTDVMPEPQPSSPQDLVSSTDHVLDNICISSVSGSHQRHLDLPTKECIEDCVDKKNEDGTSIPRNDTDVQANTKTDEVEYEAKCFRSFVRIENVTVTLNVSSKFCKTCNILFPNRSSMLQHDKRYHMGYESDNDSMISLDDAGSQLSHLEEIASETASSHLEEMMRPQRIQNPNVRRPYKCDRCNKTFTQRSHLGRHQRNVHQIVTNTRSLREKANTTHVHLCKLCNTSFNTKFLLIRHLYNHVGEDKKFKCDFCPEIFNQKVYLEAHLWKHVKDRYINAKASDLVDVKPVVPTPSPVKTPVKASTASNTSEDKNKMLVLRCNKCFCIYRTKKVLRRHMLAEHKIEIQGTIPKDMIVTIDEIKCMFCQRVYMTRKHLNSHILTMCKERRVAVAKQTSHVSVKDVSVAKIKIKTEPRAGVVIKKKIIKKSVIPAKRYYCKKCNVSFETYKGYYRHMTRRHNVKAPLRDQKKKEDIRVQNTLHKCNDCQAHFHKKGTVLRHVQSECEGMKLIKCDVCNLKFTVKTFTMHRKCHPAVNVNAVKYHIIGYDTNRSKTKGSHLEKSKRLRMYFNSKNCIFRCKECKYHFTKYTVAAKHAACHLYSPEQVKNVKPLSCEKCALTFTKFGLETHKRLHKVLKVGQFKVLEFDHKLYRTNAWVSSILNQTEAETVESKDAKVGNVVNSRLKAIKKEKDLTVVKDEFDAEQTNSMVTQVASNNARSNDSKIYLYKCTRCSFHYNLLKTATCHLYKPCVIRRHKLPPCAHCDLLFATPEAHKLYHRGMKTNRLEVVEFNRKMPLSVGKILPATIGKEEASDESNLLTTSESTSESILPSAKCKTVTSIPVQKKSENPKHKAKLYKCGACGAHFLSLLSYPKHVLRSHTLRNGNVRTKPCLYCNLSFTRAGFRKHKRIHHEGKVNLSRDDFEIVEFHEKGEALLNKSQNEPLSNITLPNVKNENESLSNMGTLNNGVITYQCALCDNRYMTKAALDMHVNIDHMEVDMCCQICDKMFANSGLKEAHLHCCDSTFKCCICKVVLPLGELQEHSSCHCNVYKCRQCGATFPKLEMLDEHLEISHADFDRDDDEDGNAISVPESGEELSSDMENTVEYTVSQSKAFNLGANPLNASVKRVLSNVCTECDYETTDQIKFVLHRHTHKDYGPMDCNKCGMKFIWNKNLMRHLRDKRCRTD